MACLPVPGCLSCGLYVRNHSICLTSLNLSRHLAATSVGLEKAAAAAVKEKAGAKGDVVE